MSWIGKAKGLNAWRNHPIPAQTAFGKCCPVLKRLSLCSVCLVVDAGYNAIKRKGKDDHGHGHGGHDDHGHGDAGGDHGGEKQWIKTIRSGRAEKKTLSTVQC